MIDQHRGQRSTRPEYDNVASAGKFDESVESMVDQCGSRYHHDIGTGKKPIRLFCRQVPLSRLDFEDPQVAHLFSKTLYKRKMPHYGHIFSGSSGSDQLVGVPLHETIRLGIDQRVDGSKSHRRIKKVSRERQVGKLPRAFLQESAWLIGILSILTASNTGE